MAMDHPIELSALADFQLVAAHGGIGRASRLSGRSKATLSRRIAELETALGVRLFERSGRGLAPTAAGLELQASSRGPLGELVALLERLPRENGRLHGRLRVSAAVVFAHTHLVAIARRFGAAHPEVCVEIVADDRFADPVAEGFDVVIRANPSADDPLVGRCLFRTDRVAVAAPTLSRTAGEPAPLLYRLSEPPPASWRLRREADEDEDEGAGGAWHCALRPALGLSSLLMMRDAALGGAGVALLPRTLVAADLAAGRLVSWGVLDGVATEVWALHTSHRLLSPMVRAFLDALGEAFPGP